jgi:hypothetical protein
MAVIKMARAPSNFPQQQERRGLSAHEAAAYAGCNTVAAFRTWVRKGLMPGPLPHTHRYDRKAIDAALDRLSGLSTTMIELSEYESWKQHNANTD